MPTYVYKREDGTTFETEQRITEDPLERCPETGQKVKRLISGSAGLIFKGDGFYLTDYARKNGENDKKTSAEADAGQSQKSKASENGSSKKSESAAKTSSDA